MRIVVYLIAIVLLALAIYYFFQRPILPTPSTIHDGETLFKQGMFKQAARKLEDEIAARKGEDVSRHIYYLALCHKHLGAPEKMKQTLETAATDFRNGEYAHKIFYELGNIYLEENKKYEARNFLSDAMKGPWTPDERKDLTSRVAKLSNELIYSPFPNPDSEIYEVKPGDTLGAIAKKFGTTAELIARVNRRNVNDIIRDGDRLKIIKGIVHIEISLSQCTLAMYLNNRFIKEYPAGVGKPETPTPTGEFTIANKLVNPDWWNPPKELLKPGESYIPTGDERNILGTRWMGFKELPRYGIHGTTNPETIGKHSSEGCIRLHNEHVEELFDFVTEGTKVIIRD